MPIFGRSLNFILQKSIKNIYDSNKAVTRTQKRRR